jgi:selenocysteine lyase/cysteine desulfurase
MKLPMRALADVLADESGRRDRPVLLCVDGVHALAAEDVRPREAGIDFLAAGCHKWLFGPRGTGIVWGRSEAWAEVSPTIPSFSDVESFVAWLEGRDPGSPTSASAFAPGGYHAFEHRWALAVAFAFRQEIGRERAAERTHTLARRLKEGLREIPGTTVRTPLDEELSAGLVCCDEPVASAVERLRAEHGVVATLTPYATRYLRFGPSIVNSEEDVDRAVAAVAAVSG